MRLALLAILPGCGGTAPPSAPPPDATISSVPVGDVYGAPGMLHVVTCSVAAASSPCIPFSTSDSDAAVAPGALYVVFYPAEIATSPTQSAIVTWGNGTGATPSQYSILLSHLASWGFVVIASTSPDTGTGMEMLAGEDYLVAANEDAASPFFGKLDTSNVAAVGHSQGADGAAQALLAADTSGSSHRFIKTLLPIELPGQEWTCFGDTDPSCLMQESFDSKNLLEGSVFFVDGSKDTLIAPPTQSSGTSGEQSIEAYYAATPVSTPRARATLIGADHNDIQDSCTVGFGCAGVGPGGYLGYITAWLMYELRGDIRARGAFAGAVPGIDSDPRWSDQQQAALP